MNAKTRKSRTPVRKPDIILGDLERQTPSEQAAKTTCNRFVYCA